MAATLDGMVEATGAVFEAKFMLPWSFSEDGAAEKYMPQLQHNMWVTVSKLAALSIITGGGKWVEMSISADPVYQHLPLTAEREFWRSARKLTRQEIALWRAGSFQRPIARFCRPRCWSANIDLIQLISRRNLLLGEFRSFVPENRV